MATKRKKTKKVKKVYVKPRFSDVFPESRRKKLKREERQKPPDHHRPFKWDREEKRWYFDSPKGRHFTDMFGQIITFEKVNWKTFKLPGWILCPGRIINEDIGDGLFRTWFRSTGSTHDTLIRYLRSSQHPFYTYINNIIPEAFDEDKRSADYTPPTPPKTKPTGDEHLNRKSKRRKRERETEQKNLSSRMKRTERVSKYEYPPDVKTDEQKRRYRKMMRAKRKRG